MSVRLLEFAVAGLFAYGGLRSLLHWSRNPFEGTSVGDHALFALFVAGRVGLWLAFGGFFLLYALSYEGEQFSNAFQRVRWYFLVPVLLAVVQLLAGYALGRRSPH